MTGHQENPGSGFNAKGEPTHVIKIEEIVRAIGIKHVKVINPNHLEEVDAALDEFMKLEDPSVIITRWPCALKKFSKADKTEFAQLFATKNKIEEGLCVGCKQCLKAGCPAMFYDAETKKVKIQNTQCIGCNVCAQICPKDAVKKED